MHTVFDSSDLEKIANRLAEIVIEQLKGTQNIPLLDTNGLAGFLNVSKSWVYEKTRDKSNGSIPRVKVGKYVRFNIHEVLEWLKRQ